MRKLGLLLVCVAATAWGGERLLGSMVVNDGGTTTNRCTGWAAYASTKTFTVNPLSKITIQCDGAAEVMTDVAGCDAGQCLRLAANQMLTTTVNGNKNLTCHAFNTDAGTTGHAVTYNGGWVAMSTSGSGRVECYVYERNGLE